MLSLDDAAEVSCGPASNVIAVDEALTRLAEFDPRKSEILELRYFGGLSNEEVAEALGVSRATVQRDLRLAKAWLVRELKREI
jgi:RNA polymerase sigma factor (sigma-70 family)